PEWRFFLMFSDTAEFGIVRKDKKYPPFRRKPESPSPKANPQFSPLPQSHFPHPSHSCEGRNLYVEGGNCTITRRYSAAEIPAFAGMGFFFALRAKKRFRLSPEWRHFLSLRTILNLAVSKNIKISPFRRKPESRCAKAQTDSPCGE
ncbi:MAG: hypothetical protein ACR2QC_11635, partial [Gammaproteobacteria bacterium]